VTQGCRVPALDASPGGGARTAPLNDSIARDAGVAAGVPGKNSLAPAASLKNQVGLGSRGDGEIGVPSWPARRLDGGQAGRRVAADVDDMQSGAPSLMASTMPTGTAGAEQARDLPFEFFVVADDRCCVGPSVFLAQMKE
jgi:hypothetical protein